ncbi:MAG: hypothetical protein REI11_19670 [Patulibacter sp.]|nr:hypothetical protein [Patulibacter sp.]
MTAGELLGLFRLEIDDLEAPFLWTDAEVLSYIDDAQKEFCRKTDGLSDATTPAVTQLPIAVGDSFLPLHPSILKIRGVTRADTGRTVEVLNNEDLAAKRLRFDGHPGRLQYLVIGEERNKARVYPLPNEAVQLQLLVFRLPLVRITAVGQELEVSDEHQVGLMHWLKKRAYLKQDADAFDKLKAADFEQRFYAFCAEVKEEERRKAHKPRTVAYGGY